MRTITLPLFGEIIQDQGGRLGAILRGAASDGSQDYALIVTDAIIGELKNVLWSDEYTTVNEAVSQHDGRANTDAMAASGNALAKQIRAIEHEGHNDFYIPSAAELRALSATVPHLFNKDDWYWSSSQYSRDLAWAQYFEGGDSCNIFKGNWCLVRAVRQVQLSHFNA